MKDLTQSARSAPVRIAVSACEIAAGVVEKKTAAVTGTDH